MPRFAANLTTMFPELPLAERFGAARQAGFEAVELLRPYDHPVAEVRGWLAHAGLELILINTLPGDPDAGERGLAALPGREGDFRAIFDQALDYAAGLGAGMIHVLAGVVPDGAAVEDCEAVFIENLRAVAPRAEAAGVRLMLEPLNLRDAPGYLHTNTRHTRRLIERAGVANLGLQYDLYHMQIMEGDLAEGIRRNLDLIGHIQFSSVPGRNEPQFGEVNAPVMFAAIDALGYRGWIGAEYTPRGDTREGLSWGRPYGLGPR